MCHSPAIVGEIIQWQVALPLGDDMMGPALRIKCETGDPPWVICVCM